MQVFDRQGNIVTINNAYNTALAFCHSVVDWQANFSAKGTDAHFCFYTGVREELAEDLGVSPFQKGYKKLFNDLMRSIDERLGLRNIRAEGKEAL